MVLPAGSGEKGGGQKEPVYMLLRGGDTALKVSSECSCTLCAFRFFSRFRLVSSLLASG
ncbi:hypothetical protein [Chromobacterium rhizoryzae]|uniref:hypothetical protein n=1 Tax=Chromobacterium rhizoryzae TaxID=1778675 RepID=UPI001D07F350|nr:hypothetical protein [Chromobacterium rhizoryzae]